MESVLSLSRLSTQITYWDRYQNAWDVMITVKNTQIAPFGKTEELSRIRSLSGVRDVLAYQKARAQRLLTDGELSGAFREAGGFRDGTGKRLVSAPLIILDDAAFLSYCGQIGAPERLDGVIVYNEVRDDRDPNFRKRKVLPYLQEDADTAVLYKYGQEEAVTVPVTAYACQTPVLREQFGVEDPHELVHFLPASLWEKIGETLGETETDLTIRVLAEEGASMETQNGLETPGGLETLDSLEEEINGLLEGYETESENRLRAKLESDRAYDALMTLFGSFCALLALFGISSVFLNTLSFVRQRRREAARYLSVGMTPCSVGKMFFVEALVLAGRPALVTLPLAALIVAWFLKTSYLDAGLFIRHAPVVPVLLFLAAIFAFVGLAYYLGARKLLRCSLTELLRDESAV